MRHLSKSENNVLMERFDLNSYTPFWCPKPTLLYCNITWESIFIIKNIYIYKEDDWKILNKQLEHQIFNIYACKKTTRKTISRILLPPLKPTFSVKDCIEELFRLPFKTNDFCLLLSKQSFLSSFRGWLIQTD